MQKKKKIVFAAGIKQHNGHTHPIPRTPKPKEPKPDRGPYSGRIHRHFANPAAVPYGYEKSTGKNLYLNHRNDPKNPKAHYVNGSVAEIFMPDQVYLYENDAKALLYAMKPDCEKDPIRTRALRNIGLCHGKKKQTVKDMFDPLMQHEVDVVMRQPGFLQRLSDAVEREDHDTGVNMALKLLVVEAKLRPRYRLFENPQRYWLEDYVRLLIPDY